MFDTNALGGITPIYMGSTSVLSASRKLSGDHPHIHGEHKIAELRGQQRPGSPPYTWGAPYRTVRQILGNGITPIYMGSTPQPSINLPAIGDHPHIHGEHEVYKLVGNEYVGSPPYTWGAHRKKQSFYVLLGITPIYMGSTATFFLQKIQKRDHPHIHGEHTLRSLMMKRMKGSPPYTWGALGAFSADKIWTGITPIYMGSTLSVKFLRQYDGDHPHIHGEHIVLVLLSR